MGMLRALFRRTTSVAIACLFCVPALAGPVSGQGTWETTLLPRHFDNDGVADAFYDTALDITWLRATNITSMGWVQSNDWAANLTVGGITTWRLPKGSDCIGINGSTCTDSEMGHLWNVTLGNKQSDYTVSHPTALTNTANFIGLIGYPYWSGSASPGGYAQSFNMRTGNQVWVVQYSVTTLAMAVTDGDVLPVPEPSSTAMGVAGLIGLWFVTRSERHRRRGG